MPMWSFGSINKRVPFCPGLVLVVALVLVSCSSDRHEDTQANGSEPSCLDRAIFGEPEDSPYILPYPVGESFLVNQGICFTNGGHRNQLAYDFEMPVGTEVLATRGGVVRDTRSDSPDNGQGDGDHNFILIQHDDGSTAFYAHLQQDGLLVQSGDRVIQGDVISTSGNSGLTGGPHLHFGVYSSYPPREGMDHAINFSNAEGPLGLLGNLSMNEFYLALPF